MEETMDNYLPFEVTQTSNGTEIKLYPERVTESLYDKLSKEDANLGAESVKNSMQFHTIYTHLYNQCCNTNCSIKDGDEFRAVPNGNAHASVMFINKMPTTYETRSYYSGCDRAAIFFSLILQKLNVNRDDVYFTDLVKCSQPFHDDCVKTCFDTYLSKEIYYVQPKVIIFNGLSMLKSCAVLGIINGLPDDAKYGMIYNVTIGAYPAQVIAIYELNRVLNKTGEDYEKCKTQLWTQILTAFKASTGGQ